MGRRGDLSRSVFILLVLAIIATCVSETEINEGVTVEGVLVGGGEQAYVVSSYTDWQYYQFIFVAKLKRQSMILKVRLIKSGTFIQVRNLVYFTEEAFADNPIHTFY